MDRDEVPSTLVEDETTACSGQFSAKDITASEIAAEPVGVAKVQSEKLADAYEWDSLTEAAFVYQETKKGPVQNRYQGKLLDEHIPDSMVAAEFVVNHSPTKAATQDAVITTVCQAFKTPEAVALYIFKELPVSAPSSADHKGEEDLSETRSHEQQSDVLKHPAVGIESAEMDDPFEHAPSEAAFQLRNAGQKQDMPMFEAEPAKDIVTLSNKDESRLQQQLDNGLRLPSMVEPKISPEEAREYSSRADQTT